MVRRTFSASSQAGFTLIELLAVIIILLSTTWLVLRSFDAAHYDYFRFSKVLESFVSQAQSLALANDAEDQKISMTIQSREQKPEINLWQRGQAVASYQHDRELVLSINGKAMDEQPVFLYWDSLGLLRDPTAIQIGSTNEQVFCIAEAGNMVRTNSRGSHSGC